MAYETAVPPASRGIPSDLEMWQVPRSIWAPEGQAKVAHADVPVCAHAPRRGFHASPPPALKGRLLHTPLPTPRDLVQVVL